VATEGAAEGAAMLAAVGAGWFADVESVCDALVSLGDRVEPSADAPAYAASYQRYRELYPALAPTFAALG
jgi:xylulokinase